MGTGELTALEVADNTGLTVRSVQRIAPKIVKAGHGLEQAEYTFFSISNRVHQKPT